MKQRILILGGNGMLGHRFLYSWRDRHEVKVTLRGELSNYATFGLFDSTNSFAGVDIRDLNHLETIIRDFRPDAVVNAIGITKQRTCESNIIPTIEINALFPHLLAGLCSKHCSRMVQLSTDCIFSGRSGFYGEQAVSDAEDLYGRSKFLGEVDQPHVVTLRKSTIGLELTGSHGLVEWFMAQRGKIRGFRGAIYSGLISSELADVVETILTLHPELSGIWNISSEPISKYDLLLQLAEKLNRDDIEIEPFDDFICDRSLNSKIFRENTGYIAPSWDSMLNELVEQIEKRDSSYVR